MEYISNLSKSEILPEKIFSAIRLIIKETPGAVFGGSIALNAVGLINRKISDIDLFFPLRESLTRNKLLNLQDDVQVLSDTVTDVNGNDIQRTGATIAGVKSCCFKVSDDELQHSKHQFTRDSITYTINIQNVNYAVQAKRAYSNKNEKHKSDLIEIYAELEKIL